MAHLRPRYRKNAAGKRVLSGYAAEFYDPNRKPARKYVSLRTRDKVAARKKLVDLERAVQDGRFDPWNDNPTTERIFVVEAIQRFLESRSNRRPKTIAKYTSVLGLFKATLPPGMQLDYLKPHHVKGFIEGLQVTETSRHVYFKHLKVFFRWCIEQNLMKANPLRQMKPPRIPKKEAAFLIPAQVDLLIEKIQEDADSKHSRPGEFVWLIDLIRFDLCTGLRLGELINLRWSDVILYEEPRRQNTIIEYGWITVQSGDDFLTKSGHDRRIPLVQESWDILMRKTDERDESTDGWVFPGVKGGRLYLEYVSKRFLHYRRLANLPEGISFHNLRHTCASWLVMKGVSLSVVQKILGHSTIAVTQRYAHLAPDAIALEMQRAFPA